MREDRVTELGWQVWCWFRDVEPKPFLIAVCASKELVELIVNNHSVDRKHFIILGFKVAPYSSGMD